MELVYLALLYSGAVSALPNPSPQAVNLNSNINVHTLLDFTFSPSPIQKLFCNSSLLIMQNIRINLESGLSVFTLCNSTWINGFLIKSL